MMNDVFKVAAVAAVMTVAGVPDAAGAVTADGAGSRAAAADTAANVLHEVVVTGRAGSTGNCKISDLFEKFVFRS